MLEQLLAYASLLSAGLMTIENYNSNLNALFLAHPDNDLLLDLELSSSDLNKTVSLINEKCYGQTVDYDSFGCCLLSHLKTIYLNNVDTLESFGEKAYALWSTLPADIQLSEPFHTLSYANDSLSWGDSKQTKDLYEKMFCYYDLKLFYLKCSEQMRYYDPEVNMLSGLYDLLTAVVDGFPDKDLNTYTKKQKQNLINNLMSFTEENAGMLSSEMHGLIYPYPELSYEKLRETLKTANEKYMDSLKARHDEWVRFAERFDELTKDSIVRSLDDRLFFDLILSKDNKTDEILLTNEYTSSYRQIIYLIDPVFSDNLNMEYIGASDAEIEILDSGYRITFIQEHEIVTVDFSGIRTETQLLDYSHGNTYSGSPWSRISDSLNAVEHKKDVLGLTFFNEKEKALLPLCGFSHINTMDFHFQSINTNEKANEVYCDFAKRAGNEHIVELTEICAKAELNSEHPQTGFRKKNRACKILQDEMKKPESEALAKLILSEIKDAATGYPAEVELDIAPEELASMRKTVTDILKQRGYEGEYPQFKKMSALKGVKVLEIGGQPAFVGNEKHMACMIDCFESSMLSAKGEYKLGIDCTVSTVFLKKDELNLFDSLDGSSGFFPYKHRRRARTLAPNFDFRDDDILSYDLERSVTVAAKTAECEKLTKEERSRFLTVSPGKIGCLFFLVFFLLSGLAFALLFCPAMFLLGLIIGAPITVLSSEAPSFSEYFKLLLFDFPWWQMFLFCFVGFGGLFGLAMTVFTALSRKRG